MTHAARTSAILATFSAHAAGPCALALPAGTAILAPGAIPRVSPEAQPTPDDPDRSEPTRIEASASAVSDTQLALRSRDGDRTAMEQLVLRHQAAVARLLWRFARNRSDLEDLVQDTFIRMVRGLPDWRAEQPLERWLLRIATNTGRDYFRRQAVRRRWLVEPLPEEDVLAAEAIEPSANPAARAAANEVKAMLAQLPPDDRTLLILHHLEGWGLAQIAAQFGWTVTATKLRAWRARQRLRALFPTREFDEDTRTRI